MADPRPSLSEADLRDVKDDLVKRVTDQERAYGGVGSERIAERVVDPIVEKINRDHERQRDRDLVKKSVTRPIGVTECFEDDFGYGERSAKAVGRFNFATGELEGSPELQQRFAANDESRFPAIARARRAIRMMRNRPDMGEWKARIDKIMTAPVPPGHSRIRCEACNWKDGCYVVETQYRKVLAAWFRKHGALLDEEDNEKASAERALKRRKPLRQDDQPRKWLGKR